MPIEKGPQRGFKLSAATNRRLSRLSQLLDKSDTAILEDAVAHLLGTLERDEPVRMTAPSDNSKAHKGGGDAA